MLIKRRIISALFAVALGHASIGQAETVVVTEDIAAGTTVEWTADNEYLLNSVIYVQDGATLNIAPGTVIRGGTNADNLVAREGIPNLVSALWVTRGGTLNAVGTREQPIIFTAEGDDLAGSIGVEETGLWGGIVIMGRAPINTSRSTEGSAADPKFDQFEGTTAPGPNGEHLFGGGDTEDSSGSLMYVSIRHAGNEFAQDSELNALTMGGVGSGTTLQYIEAYAGSDDAFEWWGGTASASHLIAAYTEDDDFDTDQGYTGSIRFALGIKPPNAGTADSRGFESDGDTDQGTLGELPLAQWSASNVTLIGRGKDNADFGGGAGWNTRDESIPTVTDSVFTDFAQGLILSSDGVFYFENEPMARIANNVWDVTTSADANGLFLFEEANGFNNSLQSAMLGGVSYTNDGGLDPRPQAGSPVFDDVEGDAGYRGAFSGPADDWADGWSAISQLGFLKPAEPAIDPMVSISMENGSVTVTYSEALTLQWSLNVDGGYEDVPGAANGTFTTETSEAARYFRAVGN